MTQKRTKPKQNTHELENRDWGLGPENPSPLVEEYTEYTLNDMGLNVMI